MFDISFCNNRSSVHTLLTISRKSSCSA